MRDCRASRGGALAADDAWGILARQADQRGHIAQGSVQVWFDDMHRKAHAGGSIKRCATLFQQAHAHRRGDPVGAGDDTKSA